MIEQLIEMMTILRVSELEEGDTHPADLPREELVDRMTMTDSLARGESGKRRAEDVNTIVEARARLAFTPGAGEQIGVQGVHRKRGEILVGDRVRMSGKFLRNTGQYFKTLETEDKGVVEHLSGRDGDDFRIATVRWGRYALPGGGQYLSECYCVGDERPSCGMCSGTGRRLSRVNMRNLERVRPRAGEKQAEPFAPF